jgi:1-phosphofructokinase family hexose kinase
MLDKTVRVARLVAGQITRAREVSSIVGGKGVNVGRQLHSLGVPVRCTGVWGGEVGAQCERLLSGEGVPHEFLRIDGMTREGVTYLDDEGANTSVFEPGHHVKQEEAEALLARCHLFVRESTWVACCGSSPGPATDRIYADLVRAARAARVKSAVDTYGTPLRLALAAAPDLVKLNREEYRNTIGLALEDERFIMDALFTFVEQGIGCAVLTDGARPCYVASRSGCWKITPPAVHPVNPTGSGDSMMAGILYGFARGWDEPTSVCFGAAAGAANAAVWNVSAVALDTIVALLPDVAVSELHIS